ncbi:MAG: hypothetical protein ABI981_03215 [Betaproteobacteria bacterium]
MKNVSEKTYEPIESAALSMHQATDNIADSATVQIDRVSGTVHRAVNVTADAATAAAEWLTALPQQAQTVVTGSVRQRVRQRPLGWVAGAFVAGIVLGRALRS